MAGMKGGVCEGIKSTKEHSEGLQDKANLGSDIVGRELFLLRS